MPIIAEVGRRSFQIRLLLVSMYLILTILGICMVYPFLITLTSSISSDMDYNRFSALPRFFWSREERFVRGLSNYFPGGFVGWNL